MIDKKFAAMVLGFCFAFELNAAVAAGSDDVPLRLDGFATARSLTNVPRNLVLYPQYGLPLPQACSIHAYNPALHAFPLVVRFENRALGYIPPEVLRQIPEEVRPRASLYLNVQDIPWSPQEPLLARAHGLFPVASNNLVSIKVFDDSGRRLLEASGDVHIHDGLASPDNFHIPRLTGDRVSGLWSIVTHNANIFVTRHILLPMERFLGLDRHLFDTGGDSSRGMVPSNFYPLLTTDWRGVLGSLGVDVR